MVTQTRTELGEGTVHAPAIRAREFALDSDRLCDCDSPTKPRLTKTVRWSWRDHLADALDGLFHNFRQNVDLLPGPCVVRWVNLTDKLCFMPPAKSLQVFSAAALSPRN